MIFDKISQGKNRNNALKICLRVKNKRVASLLKPASSVITIGKLYLSI